MSQKSIYEIYGKKAFLKVKSALGLGEDGSMGKVEFSFVVKGSQNNEHIDCYIDILDYILFMNEIKSGELQRKAAQLKAEGKTKELWMSPYGGSKLNNQLVSRYFKLLPGSQSEIVMQACVYPAEQTAIGGYKPIQGAQPISNIYVPLSWKDLTKLRIVSSYPIEEYMTKAYSLAALEDTYRRGNRPAVTEEDEEPFIPVEDSECPY